MRVAPDQLRRGVGSAIVAHLIEARARARLSPAQPRDGHAPRLRAGARALSAARDRNLRAVRELPAGTRIAASCRAHLV
ncbi:MAG: hypothetical protein WDN44_05470 [Sphingomonas sp.]